jgi:molybdopterin molybdotransferase
MPEFLTLLPPPQALTCLLEALPQPSLDQPEGWQETIPSTQALNRVTARPVLAPEALPPFSRSTVDGFAVRAADTFGAGESLPAYLQIQGSVAMGAAPEFTLQPACCAQIHTGGMLPDGADAVVMIEYTQVATENEIEVLRPVAIAENVLKAGEDVSVGEVIIPAGVRLRPAEIGGLCGLGILEVCVTRPPKVGILSTGDEVVPPQQTLIPGQIRDVNTYTLASLVRQHGGLPRSYGILPDDIQQLEAVAQKALTENDVLVLTAGSSASVRDLTAQVINGLGTPGVLVHGINVRPGKPTILGVCAGKAVIGLPGNPVSALVIAGLFVVPVIEKLLGLSTNQPRASLPAELSLNLASQSGREDWIPVKLLKYEGGYRAEPVFGKSNLIFSLSRADGLIRIPADATGLAAGSQVEVILM